MQLTNNYNCDCDSNNNKSNGHISTGINKHVNKKTLNYNDETMHTANATWRPGNSSNYASKINGMLQTRHHHPILTNGVRLDDRLLHHSNNHNKADHLCVNHQCRFGGTSHPRHQQFLFQNLDDNNPTTT